MQYQFRSSVVGGTFDRFHLGHQKLLHTAFEKSAHVAIGIATNDLFKNKNFEHLIEDYQTRKKSIADFLEKNDFTNRSEIVPIHDFYGTSATEKSFEAIFITESNKENVHKINEERKKHGFSPLEVVIVPYVLGNDNEIISSERIRKGLIDREGNSYEKLFTAKSHFVLPEEKRDEFRHPIGEIMTDMQIVLSSLDPRTMIVAVGDIVAASCVEKGRQADISVIDGKTRRHILSPDYAAIFSKSEKKETINPAGTITQAAAKCLQSMFATYAESRKRQLLIVDGEEDLLAIPAILLSPLQSVVLYGQFDKGIIVVHVSEQNKKRVQNLFWKFQ